MEDIQPEPNNNEKESSKINSNRAIKNRIKSSKSYYKHHEENKARRRLQYAQKKANKLNNTQDNGNNQAGIDIGGKTTPILESPSPKNNAQITGDTSENCTEKIGFEQILTLTDIVKAAFNLAEGKYSSEPLLCQFGKLANGKTKSQKILIEPAYKQILEYIPSKIFNLKPKWMIEDPDHITPRWKSHFEIQKEFSNINKRTLRGYLKDLQELKWLRRHGRDYHLNPFLYELFNTDMQLILLLEFAPLKLDLFDLLNLPLLNAVDQKVTSVEAHYYPSSEKYFRELFAGIIIITLTLEDGREVETALPVNLHRQYAKGSDIPHYCIPLNPELFDMEIGPYYSTDYVRSHHKGAVNQKNQSIHADMSITISYLPKDTLYTLGQKRFFEKKVTSIKHWQNRPYIELDNIDNLKQLLTERFVNGKKGDELFAALGMTKKPEGGRPEGSKNKPKAKKETGSKLAKYAIKPINLHDLLDKPE